MSIKEKKELKKVETKLLPTKFTLMVRIMVGAYLLYTSYSLIDVYQTGEGRDKVFFGIFIAAFTIIGIFMIFLTVKSYLYGKYVGGALDAGETETIEDTVTDTENVVEIQESKEEKEENE